ncbi:MAG: RNA-binding protein, partial [Gammaproteobacteria bacterium]
VPALVSPEPDDRTTCRVKAGHIMFNIYVGNLSFEATEDQLLSLFKEHGDVLKVNIVTDRDTGRPRGFGFVEMADANQGRAAIEQINGREVGGRSLAVNEAKPRVARGGGGGRNRW